MAVFFSFSCILQIWWLSRFTFVISGELAGVFERLGSNAETWQARLQKLAAGRLLGRFFAASRARLREVAERLGVHHLANLGGCAAR